MENPSTAGIAASEGFALIGRNRINGCVTYISNHCVKLKCKNKSNIGDFVSGRMPMLLYVSAMLCIFLATLVVREVVLR